MQGAILADQQQKMIEQQQRLERQQYEQSIRQQSAPPQSMGLQFAPVSNLPLPQAAQQPPPSFSYTVDGHRLGEILHIQDFSSDFRCRPSEQFSGFQWCRNSKPVKQVITTTSVLLSPGGNVAYYNKFFQSADFQNGAIAGEIERLSTLHRERAHLLRMPSGAGDVDSVIATWGGLTPILLDSIAANALAAGQTASAGILVDFLGDPRLSAKKGLPVYHLTGGPGFYWVARFDRRGRGTLRYGMCDASAIKVIQPLPVTPAPTLAATPAAVEPVAAPALAAAPAAVQPVPASALAAAPAAVQQIPAPALAPVPNQSAPSQPPTQVAATERSTKSDSAVTDAAVMVIPNQGQRVALVIGNSAYQAVPTLDNPRRDAESIAESLRSAGFKSVTLVEDATLEAMRKALRDFQSQADEADWAMVYYAGHGLEVAGQNYLIPVDARLSSDRDAGDEALTLDYVLEKIRSAKKLHLVVLDACRENPFKASMKRQASTRGIDTRGLARFEPPVANELIVYAAKDGEQAQDGVNSGHSPFAKAFLARLETPGIEINKVFRLVTSDVLQATNNAQQPFVYGSTPGVDDFYFRPN